MCGFNKCCDKILMFLRYKPRNLLAICKQILEVVKSFTRKIDVFLEEVEKL
jgi:hypothetical protein